MAQRDIEAIAEQMRLAEEAQRECDEAYERAREEERQLEKEEFDELEDEIIDPASMGFVDSESMHEDDVRADESDEFYSDTLSEDVSDCLEQEDVDEAEGQASIEVDVYNEDGFGEHFASEVMRNVPGVTAVTRKKAKPNGDITVKISGSRPDLERAFAFYVGQKSYGALPQEDKEEFESLLVFDDGDTLAEADYREAVAHCLDPVGINASTADLIAQDTCAVNLIREEKAKRTVKKFMKALNEEDMSDLSDKELDQIQGIQDALASGEGSEGMTDDELSVWKTLLKTMGYTLEQWDAMTPEQQEKAWNYEIEKSKQLSKSGFARWLTAIDPHDWKKKVRYQNQYQDAFDPSSGETFSTAFNPDYTSEISPYQHPTTYDKKEREAAVKADKERVERQRAEYAKKALLHARHGKDSETGRPAITSGDFGNMISNLTDDQVDELQKELLDYVKTSAKTPEDAANEEKVIKAMFSAAKNKKTYVDLGNIITGGTSGAPAVKKFINDFDDALFLATLKASDKDGSSATFKQLINSPSGAKKFTKVLSDILNSRKTGKNPMDPERAMRRQEWMAMLRKLGYSPAKWSQLSPEERIRLTDEYLAKNASK